MKEWSFYRHMPVILPDGRRLGQVWEIGHAVDYLHVRQGTVLVRDWYIPLSAVRAVTDGRVWLAVGRGDLVQRRWNVPPEEYLMRQGATPGYDYTSRTNKPSYGGTEPGGSAP
jgi:hypothetical protein